MRDIKEILKYSAKKDKDDKKYDKDDKKKNKKSEFSAFISKRYGKNNKKY